MIWTFTTGFNGYYTWTGGEMSITASLSSIDDDEVLRIIILVVPSKDWKMMLRYHVNFSTCNKLLRDIVVKDKNIWLNINLNVGIFKDWRSTAECLFKYVRQLPRPVSSISSPATYAKLITRATNKQAPSSVSQPQTPGDHLL